MALFLAVGVWLEGEGVAGADCPVSLSLTLLDVQSVFAEFRALWGFVCFSG